MNTDNQLFVDGGVAVRNPSPFAGTMAFRHVKNGQVMEQGVAIITPQGAQLSAITNNLSEMLALIIGLESLPGHWLGTVYSDSQVTLGRAFWGWRWKNIPEWLHARYRFERKRLKHFDKFGVVLLDGHPTRAQLLAGVGKRGHPVSEHNVWCDRACQLKAEAFQGVVS